MENLDFNLCSESLFGDLDLIQDPFETTNSNGESQIDYQLDGHSSSYFSGVDIDIFKTNPIKEEGDAQLEKSKGSCNNLTQNETKRKKISAKAIGENIEKKRRYNKLYRDVQKEIFKKLKSENETLRNINKEQKNLGTVFLTLQQMCVCENVQITDDFLKILLEQFSPMNMTKDAYSLEAETVELSPVEKNVLRNRTYRLKKKIERQGLEVANAFLKEQNQKLESLNKELSERIEHCQCTL